MVQARITKCNKMDSYTSIFFSLGKKKTVREKKFLTHPQLLNGQETNDKLLKQVLSMKISDHMPPEGASS